MCDKQGSDMNNNRPVNSRTTRPEVRMSSTPGYLELSPESFARLVCADPIEAEYDVEALPFARGKYAAVRRCVHRATGRPYAAKFLKKQRRSSDLRTEILHEVAILDACAASSRIVRLHRVFESQHDMVLLLELAPGGELQMLLDNDDIPDEAQVKRLMTQIMDGLIFLHSINVAHLDLKPQNLVLTGTYPNCDVKLCDLGISRYISAGADIRDILGTPDYVAPEVLNYESISLSTDMWSVGVLLYVLLTGCSPFGGDTKQETFCNISKCSLDFPDELFGDISLEAIELMKMLMVKDPSKRLTATQCLQHRWFTDVTQAPPTPTNKNVNLNLKSEPSPLLPRKSDQSKAGAKHKAPVETTDIDKSMDYQPPTTPKAEPEPEVPPKEATPVGMKSFRRENFKRNLSELAERLSKETEIAEDKTSSPPLFTPIPEAVIEEVENPIRKSKSMHTLPLLEKFESHHPNLNFAGEVRRRTQTRDLGLYSYRKCMVVDEDDSPPMSIAGSVTSSVASDSICDSGSEISIDSSSDRSSIISLDDSVDFNRLGRYNPNVWTKRMSLSTNDTFANAFRRFSGHVEEVRSSTPRRPARGAHTVVLNKVQGPAPTKTMCKLEFRKEMFGNVVVIREVKAGRFLQVSEVKCESVQERIRRLQVQGAGKT